METLSVMVVDDEAGMRSGVERVLRNHTVSLSETGDAVGFDVRKAVTGEEACEAISQAPPDILLLDYMLPGMSGIELMERCGTSASSNMLVVMISAYASIETALRAAKRGAYDFLAKPFTPDELKATVAKAAARIMLQRRARSLAEEKRQVRFRFISVLGHELKAPIGAIEGYLHLMRDGTLGDTVAEYREAIDRCLARADGMRKLIRDLLDLTRIESGQRERHIAEVDVAQLVREAVDTVSPQARENDVRIDVRAPDALAMHADAEELVIVLNNLLTNAVKYNRQGGSVTVRAARSGGRCVIEVADTGVGLTPEEAARLFGEFVRIKRPDTRGVAGSGLGLSIVKKVVALYDGDVSVESALGVGSTFRATLADAAHVAARDGETTGSADAAAASVDTCNTRE